MAQLIERTDVEYLRQVGVRATKQGGIYMNQINFVLYTFLFRTHISCPTPDQHRCFHQK